MARWGGPTSPEGTSAYCWLGTAAWWSAIHAETPVYPGHMEATTLGRELAHNPFLADCARMAEQITAPKGTYDVLPADQPLRRWVIACAEDVFQRYGYRRIDTPIFEETRLFSRGVGESTDIVRKEMYTFEDLGGRSMTLRPEGTAPVARAYVEHGMHTLPQPVKLYYHSPMFRYESPQSGRYRQHSPAGSGGHRFGGAGTRRRGHRRAGRAVRRGWA